MSPQTVTSGGQSYVVDFDYDEDSGTRVQTDAPCPTCGPEADWSYSQLCEAGYPSVLVCRNCDETLRVQS